MKWNVERSSVQRYRINISDWCGLLRMGQYNVQLILSATRRWQLGVLMYWPCIGDLLSQLCMAAGRPVLCLAGFVSSLSGVRVSGGFHLLSDATLRQCVDACLMTSYCLAVDYSNISRDCYVHGTTTYCADVIIQTDFVHYKRLPCSADASGLYRLTACTYL